MIPTTNKPTEHDRTIGQCLMCRARGDILAVYESPRGDRLGYILCRACVPTTRAGTERIERELCRRLLEAMVASPEPCPLAGARP